MKPFSEWSKDEQRRYYYFVEQMIQDGLIVKKRKKAQRQPMNYTEQEDFYFQEFWGSSIRTAGDREKTKEIYIKILREKESPCEFHRFILDDIEKRVKNKQFGFSGLHPSTYLNGQRWNDELIEKVPELLTLPKNEDLIEFCKANELPNAYQGESFAMWRSRLTKHIADNKIMKGE